jgi:hypothetical protein
MSMHTEHMTRRFQTNGNRDGRSVVDLVKELRDEMTQLLRQEVALARVEISEKVSIAGRNIAYLAIGGLIIYAGLLILLVAASAATYVGLVAAGMTHFTAGWLAPLIIGAVVAVIGYVFVQKALSAFKRESLVPKQTVQSVKETKQWVQEKVS